MLCNRHYSLFLTKQVEEDIMGDGLGFIFQKFSYSLGSGCLINIYVLCMLFVMGKVEFLSNHVKFSERMSFSTNVSILIFIFFALIIGVFIEGSNHVFTQYYQKHREGKDNLLLSMIKFILKPGVRNACKDYWRNQPEEMDPKKEQKSQHYDFKFMYKPDTNKRYSEEEIYPRMRATALRIAKESGKNVSRFKESSYIMQGMRLSFLLIFLCSLLAMFCIAISLIIKKCCDNMIPLLTFYMICFIVSAIFMKITELMAWGYSKRYVRKIGEWYNALGLHEKDIYATKADSHDTKNSVGLEVGET